MFGVLMLAVLLFNMTATTFFLHSHTIEGWKIVHSHPYSDTAAHSHTRRLATPRFTPHTRCSTPHCLSTHLVSFRYVLRPQRPNKHTPSHTFYTPTPQY